MPFPVVTTTLPPDYQPKQSYEFHRLLRVSDGFYIPFTTEEDATRKLRNVRSAISIYRKQNPHVIIKAACDYRARHIVVTRRQ